MPTNENLRAATFAMAYDAGTDTIRNLLRDEYDDTLRRVQQSITQRDTNMTTVTVNAEVDLSDIDSDTMLDYLLEDMGEEDIADYCSLYTVEERDEYAESECSELEERIDQLTSENARLLEELEELRGGLV